MSGFTGCYMVYLELLDGPFNVAIFVVLEFAMNLLSD